MLRQKKFGFLGAGNLNQAILSVLVESVDPQKIFVSNRSPGKLEKVCKTWGVQPVANNEELAEACDVIILGVKPQDLEEALEPIASSFTPDQVLISLAAGVSLPQLSKLVPEVRNWVRVMPNTAATIKESVIGYCCASGASGVESLIEEIFSPMGLVVAVEEGEEFEALTVSCSSGIGFVFELMTYWQEWLEEHGFKPEQARQMTVQTFVGASLLARQEGETGLAELQRKVVSKKGVTAAGLDSMQELEVERALRYSFEKAVLRDRQLGKQS